MSADSQRTARRPHDNSALSFRAASLADAADIWRLVDDSTVLDSNSPYCYLLMCRDFASTCVVARESDELLGFVTAYLPPGRPDSVFVWQVGVAKAARRRGLAKRLLRTLLSLPACRDVRFLEATVTPSNTASRRLFQSLADELEVPCRIGRGFTVDNFAGGDHEEEQLFRIGPIGDSSKEKSQS